MLEPKNWGGGGRGGWMMGIYSHITMKGMLVVPFRGYTLWLGTPLVLSRNLFEAENGVSFLLLS